MKLSEVQLRMAEKELLRMAELSAAIASDASFVVFTLIMSDDTGPRPPGQLEVVLDESTVGALRAVCRTVTGVDGAELDDGELLQTLAEASMRPANLERARRMLGHCARSPDEGRRV